MDEFWWWGGRRELLMVDGGGGVFMTERRGRVGNIIMIKY